jgi:hypothetical protein
VTPGANQSLILPQTIDNQYVLHVSPSEAELKVMQKTELEAFLALSLPVADSLTALRQSLGEQTGEAAASDTEQSSEAAVTTPATEGEVQATPDVVQLQVTALDNLLPTLTSLNQALQASDSLAQVYGSTAQWLQSQMNTIAGTGIAMPPETEAFVQQINALSSMEKPVYYSNNECLMASLSARWGNSNIDNAPCTISNRAMYVEQGDYVGNNGPAFNVVAAEFPTPVAAGWAVKQLFYRARFIGFTGDFALDDIIEYNYFFSQIDGVYTLAWSHDNWVYSISSTSSDQIDTIIKVFPF